MQYNVPLTTEPVSTEAVHRSGVVWQWLIKTVALGMLLFLALYNLTDYPTPWFDEGSHLHVPKTLVRFGVYADYSSEGFRHYGPTIGVGPTVMLPVAAMFQLFGIGLLQARLVMVLYLLAAIFVFYRLAHGLGGVRLAWAATALLVTSQSISLIEYGRQMLGEVPGLFFVLAGFSLWFSAWEKAGWKRLGLVGLLLGLAMVTKHQYLLVLAPTLGLAWLANLFYYRTAPQRTFIVPGMIAFACFALWQVYLILYLGPATAQENLAMFRQFTSGAALVLSPDLMERGVRELLSLKVYLGWLLPALIYGLVLALPRRKEGQQWGVLFILIVFNLVWYVTASISWIRYAFPGLVFASLFVAQLFGDLTQGFRLDWAGLWNALRRDQPELRQAALRLGLLGWLGLMIALPLAQTTHKVISPNFNAPVAVAAYLNQHVPPEALIETWEPEMGFLTNHNYHFPPPLLLNDAVGHIWLNKPSPAEKYNFVQTERPAYLLVGPFGYYANLYPTDLITNLYQPVTSIGGYDLYILKDLSTQ
jgi:hypothetical protein